MKLCLAIAPASTQEALALLREHRHAADLIEVRTDGITGLNLEEILSSPRPPVIITHRRSEEGGKFTGSPAEHLAVIQEAIRYGAEYVDIEMGRGKRFIDNVKAGNPGTKVIVSFHDFERTPSNLAARYERMRSAGADIIKIATMANDIADNGRIIGILKAARHNRQKAIALCMGERGQISRILAGRYGAFLTFASLDNGQATAPGQLTLTDLNTIYQVCSLSKATRVFGLIGNPVSQSKGIYYHNAAFRRNSVNAIYVNFLVDQLPSFIETFREECRGFSVTMPFKKDIVPFLDTIERDARTLEAVNTIVRRRGRLAGHNTDLPAIRHCLERRTSLRGKRAIVLGTGATARTMACAASSAGAGVTIVGRSREKAERLAMSFGCAAATFDDLPGLACDIVMNATPVGMAHQEDVDLLPRLFLREGMIVFDAVNTPYMTRLIAEATRTGCRVITGREFFETQAQLQSQLFISSIS